MVIDACELAEKYRAERNLLRNEVRYLTRECELLDDEAELLNREADWLAEAISSLVLCEGAVNEKNEYQEADAAWWREAARKAARNGK